MDLEPLAKLAVNYGLGIILSLGTAGVLFWLLKYVLHENKLRQEATEKLQQKLGDIIQCNINLVDKRLQTHDEKNAAALVIITEYNREMKREHEAQAIVAREIKEENERRRQAQEKMIEALHQINVSLANLIAKSQNGGKNDNSQSEY